MGTIGSVLRYFPDTEGVEVNNIIWLVGAVVIILAILAFFGLR
jgi:hypothetical protein